MLILFPIVKKNKRCILSFKSRPLPRLFVFLTIILCILLTGHSSVIAVEESSGQNKTYLPLIINGANTFTADEKLLGIYMQQYWTDNSVSTYMKYADSLAGKKHTVSAWFISLQDIAFSRQTNLSSNNFYQQLEALWDGGYISFINLQSAMIASNYEVSDYCPIPFSAYQVAKGDCDKAIERLADLYKTWVSQGGGRRAFIAPLPEMNGDWTSYGRDSANFKLAYQKIIDTFDRKGIGRNQVWWVFAPNGWSTTNDSFEYYYPGNGIVDVVGFSSYNYGYCAVAIPWQRWENYDTLYSPYLSRIAKMAPTKPVMISQTGTTAELSRTGEKNIDAKNSWLRTNYTYLAQQPQVLGILYYDFDISAWECNWEITSTPYSGYGAGAASPAFQSLTVQDLGSIIP